MIKENQLRVSKRVTKFSLALTILCWVLSVESQEAVKSNGLTLTANAETAYIFQEVKDERIGRTLDVSTFRIEPTISARYKSRTFDGRWTSTHTHLQRDIDGENETDNFTEYAYDANYTIIDDLLAFEANGALRYQNVQSDGFIANDFLLNAEELSKTRSNRFSFTSEIQRGTYFGAAGNIAYSDTQSEERADNNSANLDNNTLTLRGRLLSGDILPWLDWQIEGSFQDTERDIQDDFVTRIVQGDLTIKVFGNLGFSVNLQHEGNQFGGATIDTQNAREFDSYGAGLSWRINQNRYISISYNVADSDIEDEEVNFVKVDFNWNFSARTQVSGSYGRRFFGETGEFELRHNTKSLRTQVTYKEDITSFSRLIANPENLGVFVCQDGNLDLVSCFQPSSLNYQLEPGEQFTQFSQQNTEINDNIVLRKALNGQIGYEFNRLKVSLDARYSFDEYLESDRDLRTYSLGISSSFDIGGSTSITARINYGETEQRSTVFDNGSSETWGNQCWN